MALFIRSVEELSGLKQINGVSVQEIERRARPCEDRDDPLWRCRSHCGFLDAEQTLIQNLTKDWNRIRELKLTHVIIAMCLKTIILKAEELRKANNWGPDRPVSVMIDLGEEINDLNQFCNNGPQTFTVVHRSYTGYQWSLFYNPSHENIGGKLDEEAKDNMCKWNREYKITNGSNSLSITVAGDTNGGIIKYIENYGFYEGGRNNTYRLDPDVLLCVFSGRKTKNAAKVLMERETSKLDVLRKDMEDMLLKIKEIRDTVNEEQRKSLDDAIENEKTKYNQGKTVADERILLYSKEWVDTF